MLLCRYSSGTGVKLDAERGTLYLIAEVREPYAARHCRPLLAGLCLKAVIEGRIRDGWFELPGAAEQAWVLMSTGIYSAVPCKSRSVIPGGCSSAED